MQNLEFFKLSGKPHMISKAVDNLTEYRKMLLHDFRVNNTKLLSILWSKCLLFRPQSHVTFIIWVSAILKDGC